MADLKPFFEGKVKVAPGGCWEWVVSEEGMGFYVGSEYPKGGGNECVEVNYEDFMEVFSRIEAELKGDGDASNDL